ncbi:beta-glucosidase BoGH3B-like isoform X1 [Zingiber officinale]|uniref:beta-glucosidase BoGH3B-like isoform X1 n=1 Tax=Zingiber officinale TaxID=94328 RepID=UPI001C4DBE3E|nr:beta-glucosidase BoGH3B-like isoform X1 [Zingiber officinale]
MGTLRILVLLLLAILQCFSSVKGEAREYVKYKDPKQPLHTRINDLLERMTLAEKIGQMAQIERVSATPDVIKNYFIGSVLSGGGSVPGPQASAATWCSMVSEMQRAALSTRLGIPILFGIDAVHGHNNVYGATIFPHNVGLGATRDPELVRKIGAATALEVRATGIPYVFAPTVAVCRDPRWGRCYESYSEDTQVVEEMTSLIDGLQGTLPANSQKGVPFVAGGKNVAACAKHYVGDGGTNKGINENNTIVDFHGLLSIHMPPYYHAIIRGVSTIMVSYSSWNGEKMHANQFLITNFLKNKLRFRGFVISDWEGIDRITSPPHSDYSYSIMASITAGIDMVMIPYNYTEFINGLTHHVQTYDIPTSRIDDAVRRILRVKFMMGLFENPYPDLSLVDHLGSQEHRELAREAVRKSLVLLKNGKVKEGPVLPLPKKTESILVAGSHAHNLGYQCGGWTVTWQGISGNDNITGTTIFEAIETTVDPSTNIVFSENPDASFLEQNNFSYAIVVVGEPPYAETYGDNLNLTVPEPGLDLIRNVCATVKCVVIMISGRPLVVEPVIDKIDAFVAAWLPGSEGQGVADVLFGDYGFTGKLPRTWFKSVEQLPMNFGDAHYDPLFPLGFGISTSPVNA